MKFAVFGGTGRIGSRVVATLNAAGHQAVPQARSTGVDVTSGAGVLQAVDGVDVIIDVTSSPTFDAAAADFFRASMNHLLSAGETNGVGHLVVLSILGVDRVPGLDYYRAKVLQERIAADGSLAYSIIRSTQFMEFIDDILSWTSDDTSVRLPTTPIQPIAADDVADAVVEVTLGSPLRGIRNIAGPVIVPLDELGRLTLAHRQDTRTVITDDTAGLYSAVNGDVLTDPGARIAPTRYRDWLG